MNVEIFGYFAAILTTAAFLPQLIKTLKTQKADDVSLTTLILFIIGVLSWIIYGYKISSIPILLANLITLLLNILILISKIYFKKPKVINNTKSQTSYFNINQYKLKKFLILKTSKCWVWFKGNLNNGGFWKEGFTCTFDEKPGVLIESPAYVTCRVPNWRVLTKEPEDLNKSPLIPSKAIWKII